MTEKWNIVTFGGDGSDQAAAQIAHDVEDAGAAPVRLQTDAGNDLVRVSGYTLQSGESICLWLLDRVKALDDPPDWAVVTHANTTEEGGRAWVLRNHDGYMDLIDIVLGHASLYGEEVEQYLEAEHGVSVPVWMANIPGDDHITVGSIGRAMTNINEQTLQEVLARYPLFDIPGTLADPVSETRPNEERRGTALTEERTVVVDTGEQAFFETALRDHTSYDATSFVEEQFEDGRFTGTWAEYKETFWEPLDAVLDALFTSGLDQEEEMEVRGQAKTIKWQSALDWHRTERGQ